MPGKTALAHCVLVMLRISSWLISTASTAHPPAVLRPAAQIHQPWPRKIAIAEWQVALANHQAELGACVAPDQARCWTSTTLCCLLPNSPWGSMSSGSSAATACAAAVRIATTRAALPTLPQLHSLRVLAAYYRHPSRLINVVWPRSQAPVHLHSLQIYNSSWLWLFTRFPMDASPLSLLFFKL